MTGEYEQEFENRGQRIALVAVITIILALLAFIAWDQRPWANDRPDDGIGMLESGTPRPGEPAPDFALETPDGNVVRLSDFQGKPVFLNFWADWCSFCREEMPDMQRVHERYGDDLVVIGVNAGDSVETGEAFVRRVGVTYLRLYDRDLEVTDGYGVRTMPTSYFLTSDGTVSGVSFGFMIYDDMVERVEAAMAGSDT